MAISYSHMADFDLNLLVGFDALMAERNVTRAAARLGLSQSALSHNLARMRKLLGDELFFRTAGGIEPTPRARELAKVVGGILNAVQSHLLDPEPFDPASDERTFVIGMNDYIESLVMPALVTAAAGEAPGLRFEVRSIDRDYPSKLLDAGDIDLAIGKVETGSELHTRRKLWAERYVVLLSAEVLEGAAAIDLDTFVRTPHATIIARDGHCTLVDEALDNIGLKRRAVVTTPHFFTLPMLVRQTRTLAAVPESFALAWAPLYGLAVSPMPLHVPSFDISMAWHASSARNAAQGWLREKAAAALQALSPEARRTPTPA